MINIYFQIRGDHQSMLDETRAGIQPLHEDAGERVTPGQGKVPGQYIDRAEAANRLNMTEQSFFLWRLRNNGPNPVFRPEGPRYIAEQIEFLAALPTVRRHFAIAGSQLRRLCRRLRSV